MEYNPSLYAAPLPSTRSKLVDRWTSESQRAYSPILEAAVVIKGVPPLQKEPITASIAPAAPEKKNVTQLVSEVLRCHECNVEPVVSHPSAFGQVPVQRPPFCCYRATSPNVLVPRPLKELDESRHEELPEQSGSKAHAVPHACRLCKHEAHASCEGSRQAALEFAARRDAVRHKGHRKAKRRCASADSTLRDAEHPIAKADSAALKDMPPLTTPAVDVDATAVLRSTSLLLCSSCGEVTRQKVPVEQLRTVACSACGAGAGALMRLLAEDRRHAKPSAALCSPCERLPSALDCVADTVSLLPAGVVPMAERRTALGERIHVGRARVPSPHRHVQQQLIASIPDTVANKQTLERWAEEPVCANDSRNAKMCLTWGS